jgi:hypothetical protein
VQRLGDGELGGIQTTGGDRNNEGLEPRENLWIVKDSDDGLGTGVNRLGKRQRFGKKEWPYHCGNETFDIVFMTGLMYDDGCRCKLETSL